MKKVVWEAEVELETYEVEVVCGNCGIGGTLIIPKGIRADDYTRETECPNCGCFLQETAPSDWGGSTYTCCT